MRYYKSDGNSVFVKLEESVFEMLVESADRSIYEIKRMLNENGSAHLNKGIVYNEDKYQEINRTIQKAQQTFRGLV